MRANDLLSTRDGGRRRSSPAAKSVMSPILANLHQRSLHVFDAACIRLLRAPPPILSSERPITPLLPTISVLQCSARPTLRYANARDQRRASMVSVTRGRLSIPSLSSLLPLLGELEYKPCPHRPPTQVTEMGTGVRAVEQHGVLTFNHDPWKCASINDSAYT